MYRSLLLFWVTICSISAAQAQWQVGFYLNPAISDLVSPVLSDLDYKMAGGVGISVGRKIHTHFSVGSGLNVLSRGWATREYIFVGINQDKQLQAIARRNFYQVGLPLYMNILLKKTSIHVGGSVEYIFADRYSRKENGVKEILAFPEDIRRWQPAIEAGIERHVYGFGKNNIGIGFYSSYQPNTKQLNVGLRFSSLRSLQDD